MNDQITLPIKFAGGSIKGPMTWEWVAPSWEGRKLEVNVIFTTIPGTMAALRLAGQYARDLRGRISILTTQVVPYPLPLERPPVTSHLRESQVRNHA